MVTDLSALWKRNATAPVIARTVASDYRVDTAATACPRCQPTLGTLAICPNCGFELPATTTAPA